MATTFKVPQSVPKSIQTVSTFLGVDFTNSPANIDINRSPNATNMLRDVPGKVRKSMGWHTVMRYGTDENVERINGFHKLYTDSEFIIHAGTKLYHGEDVIYTEMNDARSKSWEFNKKLYLVDGKKMLVVYKDGENFVVKSASEDAYIPILTISKEPTGGGTSYEDLNLIQPGFTEQFLGKASVKDYSLSFGNLDATTCKAWVLNAQGEWIEKAEGTDFTVNRTTGVVTFTVAPGESPITGEDNVKITAYRTVEGYADRINKCSIGTAYGLNGGKDRLFLSGNPDYINYDWFSEQYDPTYFSDTSYSRLGGDNSAIVGYSVVSSYLATHKDSNEKEQNIIIRNGVTVNNKVAFKVANSLQGAGALSQNSFAYMQNEPLFLTELGIYAVTAQDVTGEKYAQNRSFYLNGKLLQEENLEDSVACIYNDMYWLCVNGNCYILDGLQSVMTDKAMPYATRQYCGFYRANVPARIMWVEDKELWFGTPDGRVCKFYTEKYAQHSYNDDGAPIVAVWETPDFDGKLFYKNKTLRYLAVRTETAIATSLKVYAMERGLWSLVKDDETFARFLRFSELTFSKFSFSCDETQRISRTKMRIKKVDKFRLRFENDRVDEPFGLFDFALEYVENGNFKG